VDDRTKKKKLFVQTICCVESHSNCKGFVFSAHTGLQRESGFFSVSFWVRLHGRNSAAEVALCTDVRYLTCIFAV
jgi:hypothetical protein